jgi:hypothetical protein
MDLKTLLLLIAFRNRVGAPDVDAGLLRFEAIAGQPIDAGDFHAALADALAEGHLHDPVRLPPGALQCHWQLELTPRGVSRVETLLQAQGMTLDERIALAKRPG